MAQPKDYDSTLARIAGNICAGLVAHDKDKYPNDDLIVEGSVRLAELIIKKCRARAVAPPEEPSR